ncbi:hypothetical protein KL938_004323 [Ogataea parapolymorpha]|nr:hypothetical protein KL938_004323 [Ogataea parapolymorpha]
MDQETDRLLSSPKQQYVGGDGRHGPLSPRMPLDDPMVDAYLKDDVLEEVIAVRQTEHSTAERGTCAASDSDEDLDQSDMDLVLENLRDHRRLQASGRDDQLRLGSKPAARHAHPVVAEPDWWRQHRSRERQDGTPERRVRTQAAARVQHPHLRGVRVSEEPDFRCRRGMVHAGAVSGGAFPGHAGRLAARHHGARQQLFDRRCR